MLSKLYTICLRKQPVCPFCGNALQPNEYLAVYRLLPQHVVKWVSELTDTPKIAYKKLRLVNSYSNFIPAHPQCAHQHTGRIWTPGDLEKNTYATESTVRFYRDVYFQLDTDITIYRNFVEVACEREKVCAICGEPVEPSEAILRRKDPDKARSLDNAEVWHIACCSTGRHSSRTTDFWRQARRESV